MRAQSGQTRSLLLPQEIPKNQNNAEPLLLPEGRMVPARSMAAMVCAILDHISNQAKRGQGINPWPLVFSKFDL
jgi:hypothetical protein